MTDTIAIIDYGYGNLHSAAKAFEHVIADAGLGQQVLITSRPEDVLKASHIVLPGQGAFGSCMAGLLAVDGMVEALNESVINCGQPFLGICVGMQLMADEGIEHGQHKGLGWIPGKVIPIEPSDSTLKIPHMGWNDTQFTPTSKTNPMLQGITKSAAHKSIHFYFVHSFMFECKEQDHVMAQTEYGGLITAIVGKDNMIGAQFHPEKSQEDGLTLIRDFINWTP